MRRLIPFEEWNKLKENIAFDGTKTEIGGALDVDGEAKINYLRSNVNYWNLEGEQGTLDDATFQALTLYNTDGIANDNELYHLAHTTDQGVIVYTHISQDSQQSWNVKAITINENNKSWVKTTQAIGGGGGGSLYQHNIYMGWNDPTRTTTIFIQIINNVANEYTSHTQIWQYFQDHNIKPIDKDGDYQWNNHICNGYNEGISGGVVKAIASDSNGLFILFGNNRNSRIGTQPTSAYAFFDNVITLS